MNSLFKVKPAKVMHTPAEMNFYRDWQDVNRTAYAKKFNAIGVVIMLMLIPFDFILFKKTAVFYLPFRVWTALYFVLNIFFLNKALKPSTMAVFLGNRLALMAPSLTFNVLYALFLAWAPRSYFTIVLIANFMVIFLSTFVIHRFSAEQILTSTISCLSLFMVMRGSFIKPSYLVLLVVQHGCCCVIMLLFRREFAASMLERFRNLSSLLPSRLARHVAISSTGDTSSMEDDFKARQRFVVCLSSDWRNYQEFAMREKSDVVSRLFETFYGIAFQELEGLVKSGNYFADWTADELFIVFYSENEADQGKALEEALAFANALSTRIAKVARKITHFNLVYDIGLASGYGLLGLQGPKQRKKTTIVGEVAGIAKRLEMEAKERRSADGNTNANPIIVMDERLAAFATEHTDFFPTAHGKGIVGNAKNIQGRTFYLWQASQKNVSASVKKVG